MATSRAPSGASRRAAPRAGCSQSRLLYGCVALRSWEVRRVFHPDVLNMDISAVNCMPTTPLVGDSGLCESAVARAGWAAVRAMALQVATRFTILVVQVDESRQWNEHNGRIGGFRFSLAVSSALKTRHAGDSLCLLLASLRCCWMPSGDKLILHFAGYV